MFQVHDVFPHMDDIYQQKRPYFLSGYYGPGPKLSPCGDSLISSSQQLQGIDTLICFLQRRKLETERLNICFRTSSQQVVVLRRGPMSFDMGESLSSLLVLNQSRGQTCWVATLSVLMKSDGPRQGYKWTCFLPMTQQINIHSYCFQDHSISCKGMNFNMEQTYLRKHQYFSQIGSI